MLGFLVVQNVGMWGCEDVRKGLGVLPATHFEIFDRSPEARAGGDLPVLIH